MAQWKLTPSYKKSLAEVTWIRKGKNILSVTTVWRSGEFTVTTEDNEPPAIEEMDDLYSCGYEVEMECTFDGCSEEIDDSLCSQAQKKWLKKFFEEYSWLDLQDHGWEEYETEMILECPPVIERIS